MSIDEKIIKLVIMACCIIILAIIIKFFFKRKKELLLELLNDRNIKRLFEINFNRLSMLGEFYQYKTFCPNKFLEVINYDNLSPEEQNEFLENTKILKETIDLEKYNKFSREIKLIFNDYMEYIENIKI